METKIIQHHEPVDFESFFENIKSQYVGCDYNDYLTFLYTDGDKHSFMGFAEWEDRVENALHNAIASDEGMEIINRASDVMITIICSPEAERPLTMVEMQYLNEFIMEFSEKCNVVCGFAEDSTLGNTVKVITLVNVKE